MSARLCVHAAVSVSGALGLGRLVVPIFGYSGFCSGIDFIVRVQPAMFCVRRAKEIKARDGRNIPRMDLLVLRMAHSFPFGISTSSPARSLLHGSHGVISRHPEAPG